MDDARYAHLHSLIVDRRARVAVVGLGYVGLPLLGAVLDAGFPAIGLDHDPEKIEKLRRGENYLPHLGPSLAQSVGAGATLSHEDAILRDADVILLCVPTPLHDDRTPDLQYVERAAAAIRTHRIEARPDDACLVSLESTTWPGTSREVLAPALHVDGAVSCLVAFSPEREDPGNQDHTTVTIPKLVGGVDDASTELAVQLYSQIVRHVVPCRTAEIAEAAKLVENVYRSVNIALVNELKLVFDAMGLNVWEVLDAAETKPFGFHRFNPGPGFGGHCVPIDPFYLAWKARQSGVESRFIELAGEVNRRMPRAVVGRCEDALLAAGRPMDGARVLVLGLAYKPDVGDVRESPSFEIIDGLRRRGARVQYHDPYVARTWRGRRHDLQMESVEWSAETLADADLVVIATDHSWYDWSFIGTHARLIVDTRNAMARASDPISAVVVLA